MELCLVEFTGENAGLYEINNFIEKYFPCAEAQLLSQLPEAQLLSQLPEAERAQDGPEKEAQLLSQLPEEKAKEKEKKEDILEAEAQLLSQLPEENVTNVYYVYLYFSLTKTKKDIVGVTAVKIRTGHVHISLIVIAPAWRRRGLATYALTHVIKSTASLRDSGSVLTVSVTFEDLHLMQFYKKYGFYISHFDTASGLFTLTFL